MSRLRVLVFAAVLAASAAVAPQTRAQSNEALAQKLYSDGQQLMRAGDPDSVRVACDKFAASQRLDPGLGTLLNLALCHEKRGLTASAWSEFVEAAAQAAHAGEANREQFAREHAAALEKRLHRLTIELARPAPGAQVALDGEALPAGTLGTEIPVDPGSHTIEVTAPGKTNWTQTINLGPDAVVTRVQAQLDDAPPEGAPGPATAVPPPMHDVRAVRADASPGSAGSQRTTGYFIGAAGVVAAGVAVALDLHAWTLKSQSDAAAAQSQRGAADGDYASAKTDEAIAFALGGVALAGIAAGVALVTTARVTRGVTVGPGAAGLRFATTW